MREGSFFARVLLASSLSFALLFGTVSTARAGVEDQPPGESPPQPSYAVALDAVADPNYFARFNLGANEQLSLTALSDPALEVDIALWDANHPATTPAAGGWLAGDVQRGVSSDLFYNRPSSAQADVWVQVRALDGSGNVGLSWMKRDATSLRQKISSTTPGYGKSVTISGTFYDRKRKATVPGASVTLWKSPDLKYWSRVASTKTTPKGAYAFKAKSSARMYYRTSSGGTPSAGMAFSKTHKVMPQSYLGTPRMAKSVKHDTNWHVIGDFKPRHVADARVVQLRFYRKTGSRWKLGATYTAVCYDYKSFSRYSTPVTLSRPGKWRVRAFHVSDEHSASYSKWKYFTVK